MVPLQCRCCDALLRAHEIPARHAAHRPTTNKQNISPKHMSRKPKELVAQTSVCVLLKPHHFRFNSGRHSIVVTVLGTFRIPVMTANTAATVFGERCVYSRRKSACVYVMWINQLRPTTFYYIYSKHERDLHPPPTLRKI